MPENKNIQIKLESKLRNYSQVSSLNRLSDEDEETSSALTAGGDESYLSRDINDGKEKNHD